MSVSVFRRDAPVLTRRGLGAGGCALLAVAEGVPKQVAQPCPDATAAEAVPWVGWKGGNEGKDGVLGALVTSTLTQGRGAPVAMLKCSKRVRETSLVAISRQTRPRTKLCGSQVHQTELQWWPATSCGPASPQSGTR